MTRRVALVSAREALALDEDMPPLVEAFKELDAAVDTPVWDDSGVDWSRYDAAVLRSTWDYADRIEEFVGWAERAARQTTLINPPEVVRWNTDKHYLQHLEAAGVPIVPTRFVEPHEDGATALAGFLDGDADEFVVKPSIGAGSRDAARYRRSDATRAREHLQRLLAAGRSTMLQPYLDRVDQRGETAVIWLGSAYSHAIRKGPLLKLDDALVAGLFAAEDITPRVPDADEHRVAAAAYAAMPFAPPLYARIDLIHDANGAPVVLELELTEPSLFFAYAPESATTFAAALLRRLDHDGSCRGSTART
jgi:O-ureido-D-serine cyclo-ligase